MNDWDHFSDFFEPYISEMAEFDLCEVREPLRPEDTRYFSPFDVHLFSSFTISDESMKYSETPIVYSIRQVILELNMKIENYDIVRFWPLAIRDAEGSRQFLFNEAVGVPTRLTVSYNPFIQGTRFAIDTMFRQVGNWYYPIIGGPMDGHLFPFKDTPREGQRFPFRFDNHPIRDYHLYEGEKEVLWPGIDLQITHRQRSTLLNYVFEMPYVYYTGEVVN